MTTRDEDILDFDFFGEEEPPSWEEPTEQRPGPPRDRPPRRRGPRFRGPGNLTPLLRLVALISLAILIVVLLAVWVEGCATNQKRERYQDYMTEVGEIGNASARLGDMLATTLTTPALKLEDLDAKLGGFVQTAENQVARAEDVGRSRADAQPAPGRDRGASVPRERPARPPDGVPGDGRRAGRLRRRTAAVCADAAARLERHHLDRLVQGSRRGGSGRRVGRGPRGADLGVRRRRRDRHSGGAGGDLATDPGRRRRRDGRRASTGAESRTSPRFRAAPTCRRRRRRPCS